MKKRGLSLVLILAFVIQVNSQGRQHRHEKGHPIFNQELCKGNRLYYPPSVDVKKWHCDCTPGYVYFTARDDCFYPYLREPCNRGEYLIPKFGEGHCQINPCKDGFVMFQGGCHRLKKPGAPCRPNEALLPDPETARLGCVGKSVGLAKNFIYSHKELTDEAEENEAESE